MVVAFVLLPRYYAGDLTTAYAYLGNRFGRGMQATASVAFLFTRLLADGVRLFAAAIPMRVILAGFGFEVSYVWIIVALAVVTIVYTYIGGIRAVVWVDVLQMSLYIVGGIISSAVVVGLQFGLFLLVGLFLWGYYDGQSVQQLGVAAADEIFPRFIVEGLPAGLSGLLLAGIMASAMSTLSSSLSALSSSTMTDLYERLVRRPTSDAQGLRLGRIMTLVWGLVFIVFANLFRGTDNPVVELGLSVAGITYGGLLGAFVLGLYLRRARQADAIIGLSVAIVVMAYLFVFQPELIGFTWYTAIGVVITTAIGWLLSRRHATDAPQTAEAVTAVGGD